MAKKLALTNIADEKYGKKYVFASYLRTDYVDKSLVIKADHDNNVMEMIFSSNDFGVAEWESGKGIKDCNKWEEEDSAQEASYLSRRYTAVISNGNATLDYAINKIIADVLNHIDNQPFCDRIFTTVSSSDSLSKVNISEFELKL